MRRYPYQHMHVVAIDRSCVDAHLVCPRDFPQQLPRPLPDISAQHWKPVLCYPHNMILAVPDRVTSGLRILHTRTVASQSPKGEGFKKLNLVLMRFPNRRENCSRAPLRLIQIKTQRPQSMMLWKIGAVHGHSLLSKKHPEKASRDTLRKQGQSSPGPFFVMRVKWPTTRPIVPMRTLRRDAGIRRLFFKTNTSH